MSCFWCAMFSLAGIQSTAIAFEASMHWFPVPINYSVCPVVCKLACLGHTIKFPLFFHRSRFSLSPIMVFACPDVLVDIS